MAVAASHILSNNEIVKYLKKQQLTTGWSRFSLNEAEKVTIIIIQN